MRYVVLDIATSALPDAEKYLEGTVRAPSNYKDEAKIAAYIKEAQAERVQMAATDVDLARITGVGVWQNDMNEPSISLVRSEDEECSELADLESDIADRTIITFGGFNFDLPVLMRRARYLGVHFPVISTDRYKSRHVDLCELLSDRNPQRRRSLQFYAKRLGWTDITKTLSGAEEAQVPHTGKWDELAESLRHDVTATYRLAKWAGVIQ